MSDVKSKSVRTGLIMVVRERVTNRSVEEGSVETPAKVGIAASEERERERERRGSSRLLRAANPLQIAASSLSIRHLFFPSH